MSDILDTGTESITTGFSEMTLWSATEPGVYSAVLKTTPTSGTGSIIAYAAVDDPTISYSDSFGGNIQKSFYQDDPPTIGQISPWIDPTGNSLLVLAGDTIDGDTAIEWTVIRVAGLS